MNTDTLESAWRGIRPPLSTSVLQGARLPGRGIWAAVDTQGLRHLLLEVPAGSEAPATRTQGLRVTVARHEVEGEAPNEYLDLTCLAPPVLTTFTAVAADIAGSAESLDPDQRVPAVIEALARWRWFWGIDEELAEREALGLFGELWFLLRWTLCTPRDVDAWTGSEGSRHDFQWPDQSVEVKVARRRSDGAVVHRIQSLDQLADPETGALFLFSLQVATDELSQNTLAALVAMVDGHLVEHPTVRDAFARKLSRRGFNPAQGGGRRPAYRVAAELLYRVEGSFPRLTPASFTSQLPAGIAGVTYALDMAVCQPWLHARRPGEWAPGPPEAEPPTL